MRELGNRLKQAREERGVSIRDIAARTKISVTALEALERGDFSRLPGGIFGRAFVRAYALEVGLEPEATVSEFQNEIDRLEREAAEQGATRPEVTSDDREFLERQRKALRLAQTIAIVVIVLFGVGLVWGLSHLWRRSHAAVAAPQAVPAVMPPPAAPPPAPGSALEPTPAAPDTPSTTAPPGVGGPAK